MKNEKLKLPKGFTLIELMVTVCILSIGLVIVMRSLLTVAGALDTSQNKIKAVQFMDEKLSRIQQTALEEAGINYGTEQGETLLGSRKATWNLEIIPLEDEELEGYLNKVILTVSWKEANIPKNAALVTYLENKE